MNQPRHPLRINVGFLIYSSIGTSRDIHFEYPHLKLVPDLEVKDFAGLARIGRTPQGMLFQCEFSGITRCECVRCLTEFDQPLKTEFSELFAFTPVSAAPAGGAARGRAALSPRPPTGCYARTGRPGFGDRFRAAGAGGRQHRPG